MIISHRHRYLFIEVPHTASSAIGVELRRHYGGEAILTKHANWSQFRAQASADERKYFVFGSVRNPLDTIVTEYFKYRTNHAGAYTDPARRDDKGGWVEERQMERYEFVGRGADFAAFFARYYTTIHHNWVLIGRFDRVMRFENMANDFPATLRQLGIEPVRELPVSNRTQREADFEALYTPEIRDRAVRLIGPFMEKWGYEFPEDWGRRRAPLVNRLRFAFVESAVNLAARQIALTPQSPLVQGVKRLVLPARRYRRGG